MAEINITHWLTVLVIITGLAADIVARIRIASRVGRSGWIGFFSRLLPVGGFVFLWFAYADWPAARDQK